MRRLLGRDAPPHGTPARPRVIGCRRKSVLGYDRDSLSAAPSARRTHSLGHSRPRRLGVDKLTTKAASHRSPPFCGQRAMPLSSAVLRPLSFVLLVLPVLLVPREERRRAEEQCEWPSVERSETGRTGSRASRRWPVCEGARGAPNRSHVDKARLAGQARQGRQAKFHLALLPFSLL